MRFIQQVGHEQFSTMMSESTPAFEAPIIDQNKSTVFGSLKKEICAPDLLAFCATQALYFSYI